jgi:hypothetical protein
MKFTGKFTATGLPAKGHSLHIFPHSIYTELDPMADSPGKEHWFMSDNAANLARESADPANGEDRAIAKGLTLYKDTYLGFSFFRPSDWFRFDWLDGRRGVLFGPIPDDNSTLFAVAVQDLGTKVTEADLSDLHMGFIAGIGRLSNCQVESQNQWKSGDVIGMEAKYTFTEQSITRKRWVRVLYQDTRQITLTAQGASTADYDHWLPMFHEAMMTFRIQAVPGYKQKSKQTKPALPPQDETTQPVVTDQPADTIDTATL